MTGMGPLVPIVVFFMLGLIPISFSPVGRAFARRISGEREEGTRDAELGGLAAEMAQLRRELDEVQNRLDFAERMLAQVRDKGLLPAPKEP